MKAFSFFRSVDLGMRAADDSAVHPALHACEYAIHCEQESHTGRLLAVDHFGNVGAAEFSHSRNLSGSAAHPAHQASKFLP